MVLWSEPKRSAPGRALDPPDPPPNRRNLPAFGVFMRLKRSGSARDDCGSTPSRGDSGMGRASLMASVAILLGIAGTTSASAAPLEGIHKIQHVVVIMQENRSFDSYFGTYPGANGIPAGVCVSDPLNGGCVAPFHDFSDMNFGGPHGAPSAAADINGGRMDGFVRQAEQGNRCRSTEPSCSPCTEGSSAKCIDAMGYHDAREIPNYWAYAENYVLQDNMYEPNSSWSWPEHLFLVSAWSATCSNWNDPMSCLSRLEGPPSPGQIPDPYSGPEAISLPWTDITYLLHRAGVSWAYYVFEGNEPDCEVNERSNAGPCRRGTKLPASGTRCQTSPTSSRTISFRTSSR
jgi:phospholipase C